MARLWTPPKPEEDKSIYHSVTGANRATQNTRKNNQQVSGYQNINQLQPPVPEYAPPPQPQEDFAAVYAREKAKMEQEAKEKRKKVTPEYESKVPDKYSDNKLEFRNLYDNQKTPDVPKPPKATPQTQWKTM